MREIEAVDQWVGGWQALIEAMLHPVWLIDVASLEIVGANAAAGTLLGLASSSLIGMSVAELAATPEDLCFWDEVAAGLGHEIESETLMPHADGGTVPVTRRVSCVAPEGAAPLYVLTANDRSDQLRANRELEAAVTELRATLESTADGILVTDLHGRIRNFNHRFAALWDVPQGLLLGRDDDAVLEWMRCSVADPHGYVQRLAAIDDATMLQTTDVMQLQSGRVLERVTLPQCSRGRPIGRVFSFRDITERIEARERIEVLSHTDPLTGLPNRRLLTDRIEFALHGAQRDGAPFVLLLLNLDHFKQVNDTVGHSFGDSVLIDVAERLKSCLRQIDTVARLGGDEFVLLLQQADASGAEATTRRIREALAPPFKHGDMSFTVTASVGAALYPTDGGGMDELLRCAEAAMHEAKAAGRGGHRFYRAGADSRSQESRARLKLDHAMRLALDQGRFRLHYQPKLDMTGARVVGAEALLRWSDIEQGEISPGVFIPVAEESGFIVAIGDWVLHQAAAQAAAWAADGRPMAVSVNVSALQFRQPGFVDGVARALSENNLAPELLELELTESILIQDANDALLRLDALAALGVKLSIDDFGTGYSSLGYLKRFPIDTLKIDRSFVRGLPGDASDAAIVHAIVQLSRAMKMQVVAEGVETEAQREFLRLAGCDLFQGFLFSPALDVPGFQAKVDALKNGGIKAAA